MTTEHTILMLDCSGLVTAALLLFVAGNAFRDKGPAGHDERIQRPLASRLRCAKDGEMKIPDLFGESGQAGIDAATNCKSTRTTISTPIIRMAIREMARAKEWH
jgi:hypothetical protein